MRLAILSALLLSLVTAAPHSDAITSHSHTPRPWRRLSDSIVNRIWGFPTQQKSLGDFGGAQAAAEKQDSRYGEDVVLRFKIRTAEEAAALAEAVDILFLDVCKFVHVRTVCKTSTKNFRVL